MLKKSLSAALSAALLVACTPLSAVEAVAAEIQGGPRLGAVPGVTLNTAIPALPNAVPGASLPGAALSVPSLPSAAALPSAASAAAPAAAPVARAAAKVAAPQAAPASAAQTPTRAAQPIAVAVGAVNAPKATAETGNAALDSLYMGGRRDSAPAEAPAAVAGAEGQTLPSLSAASPRSAEKPAPAVARATDGGSLIGIGLGAAAVVTAAAVFSKDFRNLLARAWNAALGAIGIGVKKMETPEVMAQRIIDQLNAAKPVYNRKVQDASTMVEKLKLQISKEKDQVAELEKGITAILSDSDPNNDVLAESMLKQQKILQGSVASSTEQLTLAETTLANIKDERARFFAEREETIAKINAKLTQAKAAEIRKQMADLKGGFQIGDLKDNMDKFEQAVDDTVAAANGAEDSVNSNPDEIIKKAKDSLKDKEVQDEITRRKAEIAAKNNSGKTGGKVLLGNAVRAVLWAGAGFGLAAVPVAAVFVALGLELGAMKFGVMYDPGYNRGMRTGFLLLAAGMVAGAFILGTPFGVAIVVAPLVAVLVAGFHTLLIDDNEQPMGRAAAKASLEAAAKNNDGKDGGKLATVDFIYFGLMGVMMGVIFAMHFPVIGSVAMAAITIGLNKWNLKRGVKRVPFDLAAHEHRAVAVGMALNVLWVGATGVFAFAPLIGALIAVAASVWHSRQEKLRDNDGGLIAEVGIGAAALVTLAAIFSKDFRGLLARAWNATLGAIGLGVKKMETPEVMAQRIIDQLNAAKPVYNRKVQDASTLVEKLKLQITSQEAKSADLDKTITALLSDNDTSNDTYAATLIKQKQTLDASTASTKEQLALSQTTLENIKEERARFFADREETIAKINAKLTQAKAAEIRKQMADLKGGFQIGDLKDNMDKFEQAVDDKVAEANGAEDSVNSNPDQIIKNAKDQLRDKEIQEEIARRKAEIAAKNNGGKAGGFVARGGIVKGLIVYALGAGLIAAVMGLVPGLTIANANLDLGLRILGVLSVWAGMDGIEKGRNFSTIRATLMVVTGLATIGAAAGLFGPLGGLTAVLLGITGFFYTLRGITRFASGRSDGGAVGGIGDLAKRFWNALLGIFGMGVKKMETPEVMAQRIIDQLNAAKPVYNRKVQDASTMVEKLKLQIEKEKGQVAELEKSITAILSDSDPNNDVLAESMLKQQKILQGSVASSTEQLTLAQTTLDNIKEERARFFSEREETIAKINAKLTQAKAAEIRKQMADLKGGFQIGDLKDNMDKFEQAVDDTVAAANGAEDSVNSNPDEIIKKAKDSLKDKEVQDEIARRKAEIAAKNNGGNAGGQLSPVGTFAKLIGIGFALYAPFISAVVFAAMGLIALIMVPSQAQKLGRSLAVIGLGTLGAGAAAMFVGAKLGLTIGAFGSGLGFVVPGALALAAGLLAAWRAHQAHAEIAGSVTVPTSAPVTIPTPTPAGSETQPSAPSSSSSASGAKFSLKPAADLLKRFWNALLGIFGLGVKKMETPEVMAQRLIDQLNAAKPVYNQKVRDASTLVEKLKLQISSQESKAAELDKTITALLNAGGEKNETLAASALKQKQVLDGSTAASQEQLASAQSALEHIKEERARFFADREESLAKIQAGLTKAKAAEMRKQMADLKGGFSIGDLKDNMDRFEDAVNDRVAGANGAEDSVNSNPDEIIKKAKESMQDQDIAAEIARRKKEIADKAGNGKAGGALRRSKHKGVAASTVVRQGAGFTYSYPEKAFSAVVSSAKEWEAIWKKAGVAAPVSVDFRDEVAVVAFLGSKPAGVEPTMSIVDSFDSVVVTVGETSGVGAPGAVMTVMRAPYAVIVLPKTKKPVVVAS